LGCLLILVVFHARRRRNLISLFESQTQLGFLLRPCCQI
jgi:hypothetical protein